MIEVKSCPNCGANIKAFSGRCEACGTEIQGLAVSKSVKEFAQMIGMANSDEQRINLIKAFPIPNTKEDVMEYMILASSNIGYKNNEDTKEYEEAWITKFTQIYQKAKLVFAGDSDFSKIENIFEETLMRKENADNERKKKEIIRLLISNLGTVCGVIAVIISVVMDFMDMNSSMIQLLGVIVLLASADSLKKKACENIDCAIAVGSGFVCIVLSFLLHNGSILILGGFLTIVFGIVSFLKHK